MQLRKKILRNLIYYVASFTLFVSQKIPLNWNLFIGSCVGRLAYIVLQKEKKKALDNLQRALSKEKSKKELRKIAKYVFINFGKNLFELFWSFNKDRKHLEKIATFEGMEYLQHAFNKGKGLIVISPHLGNWEFMAQFASMAGYPVNVVATRIYDHRLNNLILQFRSNKDVKTIFRDDPSVGKKIMKVLKKGEIIGLLIDQDTKVDGVYIKFFNQLCYTPAGAAILARRTGAPVLLSTIYRNCNEKHIIKFSPAFKTICTSDAQNDTILNTQLYTNLIEAAIRKNPDQWVWMHQRWKSKPQNSKEE
jgi:KDO2-lipid IV(A) lauroyltransferase